MTPNAVAPSPAPIAKPIIGDPLRPNNGTFSLPFGICINSARDVFINLYSDGTTIFRVTPDAGPAKEGGMSRRIRNLRVV
jgi:hypothetical protein